MASQAQCQHTGKPRGHNCFIGRLRYHPARTGKESNERTELITGFKKELRSRSIADDIYTQATNIEDEKNGLIDEETVELKVPAGLLNLTAKDD